VIYNFEVHCPSLFSFFYNPSTTLEALYSRNSASKTSETSEISKTTQYLSSLLSLSSSGPWKPGGLESKINYIFEILKPLAISFFQPRNPRKSDHYWFPLLFFYKPPNNFKPPDINNHKLSILRPEVWAWPRWQRFDNTEIACINFKWGTELFLLLLEIPSKIQLLGQFQSLGGLGSRKRSLKKPATVKIIWFAENMVSWRRGKYMGN